MIRTWHRRGLWIAAIGLAVAGGVVGPAAHAGGPEWVTATWESAAGGAESASFGSPDTPLALALSAGAEGFAGARLDRLAASSRQPAPVPQPRGPLIRRMRPNTISLGIQAQYGGVRGSSRLADGFDHGPGYAFRFRYMLGRQTALGFSFEHQRYGSVQPPLNVPGDFADSHVVVTTVSVEGVFYKDRARETHPYFVIGAGYASPDLVYADDIAARINEGAFLVGGLGFERFIRQRFSVDGSLRVYGHIANSEFSSIGQVSLGIHLYPGD